MVSTAFVPVTKMISIQVISNHQAMQLANVTDRALMLFSNDTLILCGFSVVVICFLWRRWCSRREATKPSSLPGSAEPQAATGAHCIEPRKLLGIDANAQLTQEQLHHMHRDIIASSSTRTPMHTQSLVSAVVMLAMESKLCKADVDCARLTQDVQEPHIGRCHI
jgi:hypothetical protein